MRAASGVALCVTLAWSGAARADLKVGTYAPDVEAQEWINTDGDSISLAEYRGLVCVLFFWGPAPAEGEAAVSAMARVNGSRAGAAAGVFVIGLTSADVQTAREFVAKQRVYLPVGLDARKSLADYEITLLPRAVIIDPNGKVAWSGWPGDKDAGRLIEEISKVLAQVPPTRTHPELADRVHAYLKEARQAIRAERYRQAFEAAQRAFDLALRGDPLKTRCQDVLDLIEAIGRDKLATAERAVDEQNFEEAASLLVEVRREFRGVQVAGAARRKIDTLRKTQPDFERVLEREENVGQAENLLAAAMDQIRAREFGKAYDKLEDIVQDFAGSATAAKAQTLLERMRKNEDIMAAIRDHKAAATCRVLLSQAALFARDGRIQKARELYTEIMEKFPDTTFADEAARRLAHLR